ncbi:MAG: oligopeptide ABC transporter substrate-binding protein [Betaproteobacteria bacterium]|nr:MAG: oligopeptide ABC transporter substrate-binding protein [Betaproteobacteria bacterium]
MKRIRWFSLLVAALVFSVGHAADNRPAVVVAVNELPRGLEPADDTGNVDIRATYSVFDTLLRRDFSTDDAKLKPALAESWQRISPTVVEVKLRRGVVFHSGDPFDADDVVFTFSPERLSGKAAVIPSGRQYFGHLKEVQKIDSLTVPSATEKPDPVFEQRLSTYASWIVSHKHWARYKSDDPKWMQRALGEVRWNPVGTGPLKFKGWKKDQFVEFEANDRYFLGRPAFKSLTFREVPELAARIAGLATGEFDIIVDVTPDQIPVIQRYKDLAVQTITLENSHVVVFNSNAPSLSDKRLRQALSLAIDRKRLRDALWQGRNYTPNGHQLPSFGAMYNPQRKGYEYDPVRARALVKASGYDGSTLSLRAIPNYYLNGTEVAQILLEMWKAVGINVKLDLVDNFKQVRGKGIEMHLWSNTYRIPDPAGAIIVLYGPNSQMQRGYKFWTAPAEFNEAVGVVLSSTEPKTRYAAFQKMLDIFEDEMPITILYNASYSYASKRKFDWKATPILYMDFRPDVFRVRK